MSWLQQVQHEIVQRQSKVSTALGIEMVLIPFNPAMERKLSY